MRVVKTSVTQSSTPTDEPRRVLQFDVSAASSTNFIGSYFLCKLISSNQALPLTGQFWVTHPLLANLIITPSDVEGTENDAVRVIQSGDEATGSVVPSSFPSDASTTS